MKPEPLTKEKIKYLENGTFKEIEIDKTVKEALDYIYPDKEYEHFSKELLEDEINIIKKTLAFVKEKESTERLKFLILKRQIENRLKWLLKEIEKKQEETLFIHKYGEGFYDALKFCKDLIKKAFEDVLRE